MKHSASWASVRDKTRKNKQTKKNQVNLIYCFSFSPHWCSFSQLSGGEPAPLYWRDPKLPWTWDGGHCSHEQLAPSETALLFTPETSWKKRDGHFGCFVLAVGCRMGRRAACATCAHAAPVHSGQHPAWACPALMRLANWVKMWKVNYVRISCDATNGWKIPPSLTSSSPHPETPKPSRDFQLVRLKVNRFSISDLCHLSIWLAVAAAWAPVVIYSEVVVQPSGSCIYVFYPPDPLNAPRSNKCRRLLKNNLVSWKKSLCAGAILPPSEGPFFFLAFRFRFFFFGSSRYPWKTVKSTDFFFSPPIESLEHDYLAPRLLFSTGIGAAPFRYRSGFLQSRCEKKTPWQIPLADTPRAALPRNVPLALRRPRRRAGSCTSFSTVLGGKKKKKHIMVFPWAPTARKQVPGVFFDADEVKRRKDQRRLSSRPSEKTLQVLKNIRPVRVAVVGLVVGMEPFNSLLQFHNLQRRGRMSGRWKSLSPTSHLLLS